MVGQPSPATRNENTEKTHGRTHLPQGWPTGNDAVERVPVNAEPHNFFPCQHQSPGRFRGSEYMWCRRVVQCGCVSSTKIICYRDPSGRHPHTTGWYCHWIIWHTNCFKKEYPSDLIFSNVGDSTGTNPSPPRRPLSSLDQLFSFYTANTGSESAQVNVIVW